MPQHPVTETLTQEIALHCQDEQGRPMSFMASFGYSPDDPYAVWLTFHVPTCAPTWAVARSLLWRGLSDPVGHGNVRLRPNTDEYGRPCVEMVFLTRAGRLTVAVRSSELRAFLEETWDAVSAGMEHEQVDLDDLVVALLAS